MPPPEPPTDLSQKPLAAAVICAIIAAGACYLILPVMPTAWGRLGGNGKFLLGVLAAVLMLGPAVFSTVKRGGSVRAPRFWLHLHILTGAAGICVIALHAAGGWNRPPVLLVLLAVYLLVGGLWARTKASSRLSMVGASRYEAFLPTVDATKGQLKEISETKRELLVRLDEDGREGTFSLRRRHWLRHPRLALAYWRLARSELGLLHGARTITPDLAYGRALHIAAAVVFFAGLAIHVVTVTFFAGYVAGGREIDWWHLASWGG